MAALTVQPVAFGGLAESFASAGVSGDTIADDGKQRTFLEVNNGSGGSINVTITAVDTSKVVDGIGTVTVADKVVAVGASARKLIGPFTKAYRDGTGIVSVGYSAVSSVTVRAVRCDRLDA